MPVLNTANALKLGTQQVAAVYAGPNKVWPAGTPEHTIFPDTPFSPALTLYADGTPNITLYAAYYRIGAGTAGWRVKGGRVYIPAGLTGLPGTVTIGLWITPYQARPGGSQAPYASKTVPTVIGGWSEARFDTPRVMDVGLNELAWIGYTWGDGHYLHVDVVSSAAVKSHDNVDVYRASVVDGGAAFSCYKIGSGDTQYSNGSASYGTDCIWDEG